MTSTNGLDVMLSADAVPPALLSAVRADVLNEQRSAIIKEREMLTVRFRVQKRIGAEKETLDGLLQGLEQCETAMQELVAIAREWGLSSDDS